MPRDRLDTSGCGTTSNTVAADNAEATPWRLPGPAPCLHATKPRPPPTFLGLHKLCRPSMGAPSGVMAESGASGVAADNDSDKQMLHVAKFMWVTFKMLAHLSTSDFQLGKKN